MDYYLDNKILYKRLFNETLLRCFSGKEAEKTLQQVHEVIYATHAKRYIIAK
jgi:hypothetical protein